jgi:hypothetical protein
MPDFGRVSLIEASPHNPAGAYVAVKNYQNEDRKPYIFKTADYGKTWAKIVNGIPAGDFVHAVREDTVRAGLLFAGTEHGIYVSFDDGANWQSLRLNLPDTQVSDLVIEGNDLVIATHGRSFYILDNIGPLRQLTPAVLTTDVHLFQPPVAERNVSQARIDYYLPKPASKVTIDILDSKGTVIRSFTGTPNEGGRGGRGGRGPAAADAEANAEEGGGDEGGGRGRGMTAPPPDKAGLNRFTWDGRYPGAKGFSGLIYWSGSLQGPAAVPGNYQVRLTADGKAVTEPLVLEKDPRLDSATLADLKEQFDLSLKVRDMTTQANEMVILIRELKKQMDDRLKQSQGAALKDAMETLRAKLTAIEEDVYQVRNRSNQDPLNFPIKLNNKLSALQASVDRGDGKPTAASYEVQKLLDSRLAEEAGKLTGVLDTSLPGVNRMLAAHNLKELVPTKEETKAEP